MIVSLRLQHFRSYTDAHFTFDPSVNIIAGPNASGKTNLLEAVQVVALGSSYRAKDAELIAFDAPWARLDAQTQAQTRVVKLQAGPSVTKTFEIDNTPLKRLLAGRMLPMVLFEPDHLLLLGGSPDMRRAFLDDLIERTVPDFGTTRRHYKRVLAHRNALLKKAAPDIAQQLFVWNIRLGELGAQIVRARAKLIAECNEHISRLYTELSGRDSRVELGYLCKFDPEHYESQIMHKLEHSLDVEIARGYTLYGPHRDDMSASIDGRLVQEAASRGENRTLVLALKILELQTLERVHDQKPLLLLDDVFSELDSERRKALTRFVQSHQTFITTTDADVLTPYFGSAKVIATTLAESTV